MLGFSAISEAPVGDAPEIAGMQPDLPEVQIDATRVPRSRKVDFIGGIGIVTFSGGIGTVVFD